MTFSPEKLLSAAVRQKCVAKLKETPSLIRNATIVGSNAAVLVPLCVNNGELHLLYTLRSAQLKSHAGQVSFPGGRIDGSESLIETALRETEEEIGVPRDNVDVWCVMPQIQGRDKKIVITPVVGQLLDFDMSKLNPNTDEVAEIFTVPLSTLCNVKNQAYFESFGIVLPVYLCGKHIIWGITGLITHVFLQSLLPSEIYHIDFTGRKFELDELMSSKL